MGIHRYEANAWLDATYGSGTPATLYLTVLTEQPVFADTGTDLVEPTAVDYARLAITNNATNFPAAVDGVQTNGAIFSFAEATNDWGTLRYWAFVDAATDGNLLASGSMSPRFIGAGRLVRFLTSALTIRTR